MSETIQILIADDHTLFRDGLRALFGSLPDTTVIGEAANGTEAIAQAEKLQPDVILMDIQMPGVNGIEATRRIVQTSPHIGVIVVTMFEDDDSVFAAMRAGARGYAHFGPLIAARLQSFFADSKRLATAGAFPELTEREREVLELIAKGHSNAAIGRELTISIKTVRNHVSNIFSKLQVADRAQAIIRAREVGLGQ
jgi:DNA-binding NarL/FixJ family response regulator